MQKPTYQKDKLRIVFSLLWLILSRFKKQYILRRRLGRGQKKGTILDVLYTIRLLKGIGKGKGKGSGSNFWNLCPWYLQSLKFEYFFLVWQFSLKQLYFHADGVTELGILLSKQGKLLTGQDLISCIRDLFFKI